MADVTDTDLIEEMTDVRNKAINYLSKTSSQLPATVTVDTGQPLPAALVATLLYNDASRDQEIVDRNSAPHPLFMPTLLEAIAPSVRVPA